MARIAGSDGARTEAAIRGAAIDLISAKGFAAVTLRQIADRVGIQAGGIYRYFPSKAELLASVITGHMEELLAAWEEARTARATPVERLDAFVSFHIRFHATKPKEVYIANMELRSLEPAARQRIVAMRETYERILEDILRAGIAENIFSVPDLRVTVNAILAMLTGLTTWYRDGGRLTPEELAACYRKLVLRGVS